MRIFLAVFPPPEVQRLAFAITETLRRSNDGVSWVKLDNLHYTLRFIGEVGEDGARRVGEAAQAAVAGKSSFSATLGGLGAFPNSRRARVIWASLAEGAEALVAVARALETELRKRGFERADHPFSAHLTLGRVRFPKEDWTARLEAVPPPDAATARFDIDRICVVQSKLSPKGSTYTVREEARLAA
jgi:2'-5' RNA ligase